MGSAFLDLDVTFTPGQRQRERMKQNEDRQRYNSVRIDKNQIEKR